MIRKVSLGIGAIAMAGLLCAPAAMAQTTGAKAPQAKQSLVALGDSITFGYNLNTNVLGSINNHHTSKDAFPYLMGAAQNMRVSDLGVPGWTSQQLLAALDSNQRFQQDVKHANVITIDIGSNDLLHVLAASKDNLNEQTIGALEAAGAALVGQTLPQILMQVHKLNPAARVVLYNLYDPWPGNSTNAQVAKIHTVAEQILPILNGGIGQDATRFGALLANAYGAINGNQNQDVLPGGVHPTVAGQEALAAAGEQALASGTGTTP